MVAKTLQILRRHDPRFECVSEFQLEAHLISEVAQRGQTTADIRAAIKDRYAMLGFIIDHQTADAIAAELYEELQKS